MVDWTSYNLTRNPYFTSPLGPRSEPLALFVGHERELAEARSAVAAGMHHMVRGNRGVGSTSCTNGLKEQTAALGIASHLEPVPVNGLATPGDLMIQIIHNAQNARTSSAPGDTEARAAFDEASDVVRKNLGEGATALARALQNTTGETGGARPVLVHLTMGGTRTADLPSAREALVTLQTQGIFAIPALRFVIEGPLLAVSIAVGREARLRAEIGDHSALHPITPDELREGLDRRYAHLRSSADADVAPPVAFEAALQLHDRLNGDLRRTFAVLGRAVSLISRQGRRRTANWDDLQRALHTRGRL